MFLHPQEDMFDGALTSTFCGTPLYIAPEILLQKMYDASVDWWALGVMIYEMLIGNVPFNGRTDDIYDFTLRNVSYPVWLSSEATSIMEGE